MISQQLAYDYDRAALTCAQCGGAATNTALEHNAGCLEMARIIAGAVSAERERIRAGAEALARIVVTADGCPVRVVAQHELEQMIGGQP